MQIMTPDNDRWNEFADELYGPNGCNFTTNVDGKMIWDCSSNTDKPHTRTILAEMGLSEDEIEASCLYFEDHAGFCDCEILLNVDPE